MKHILTPIAFAFAVTAFSGHTDDKEKKPAATTRYQVSPLFFKARLDLSDKQNKKWQELSGEQTAAMRKLYQQKDLNPQARYQKMQAIRQKIADQLLATLTAEQKKKFNELRTAQVKRSQPWWQTLKLSEAQQEKMQALNKERQAASLKVSQDFAKKIEAIYTDEQKAKRKELLANRQGGVLRGNFFKQLGFTDAQQKQWRELQTERSKAYAEESKKYREALMKILTKEQCEQYEKRFTRPANAGGRAGVARNWTQLGVYGKLDLSEEQQKQLGAAHQTYSKASTEIYRNKDLTQQEKRAQMGKAIAAYQAAHNKILTAEQRKKLADLRAEQRKQRPNNEKPREK